MAGYYPVPFAKQCKIIWKGDLQSLHFYHVNIRLYEKGTKVNTFQKSDIQKFSNDIATTKNILTNPDANYNTGAGDTISFAADVKSGEEKEILNITGNKGITCLEMQILDNDLIKALRQTVYASHLMEPPIRRSNPPWAIFSEQHRE